MKRKNIVGIICISSAILLSTDTFGQTVNQVVEGGVDLNPKVFVAIIAGVILALGFQMILTNLSVATGISAIGDLRGKKKTDAEKAKAIEEQNKKDSKKTSKLKSTPIGVLLMSGVGIWNMITAAISLFFACFIAVKLSFVADNGVGLALGLVTWAVFFMTLLYLESKAVGGLITGVFSLAVNAVKTGFSTVGSVFTRSETARVESAVAHSLNKVGDGVEKLGTNIYKAIDDSDLKQSIQSFLAKMEPKAFDPSRVVNEFASLINDIKIEQRNGELPGERDLFLKVASRQPEYKHDHSKMSKFFDVAMSMIKFASITGIAGGLGAKGVSTVIDKNKIEKMKHDVEEYVISHSETALPTSIVKAEIDEIFDNPDMVNEIMKMHVNSVNKDSVATIVSEKQGVSREEALVVASRVDEAINIILREANIKEMSTPHVKDMISGTIQHSKDDFVASVERRIQAFFDKVDRPELDYHLLKNEFDFVIDHPKQAPEVLKRRLKEFDMNTVLHLIASVSKNNKEEANGMVHKFETARKNIINKVHQLENDFSTTLDSSMATAKAVSIEEAENARKTAMAGSWWLLGSMIVSAAAAAFGAMAGL